MCIFEKLPPNTNPSNLWRNVYIISLYPWLFCQRSLVLPPRQLWADILMCRSWFMHSVPINKANILWSPYIALRGWHYFLFPIQLWKRTPKLWLHKDHCDDRLYYYCIIHRLDLEYIYGRPVPWGGSGDICHHLSVHPTFCLYVRSYLLC